MRGQNITPSPTFPPTDQKVENILIIFTPCIGVSTCGIWSGIEGNPTVRQAFWYTFIQNYSTERTRRARPVLYRY